MESKKVIYNCIVSTFKILEHSIEMQQKFNVDTKASQNCIRNELNSFIREYKYLGGTKNIDKFLKYYV